MTFQDPIPLTFREQFHETGSMLLTFALAAPVIFPLAYFARFES